MRKERTKEKSKSGREKDMGVERERKRGRERGRDGGGERENKKWVGAKGSTYSDDNNISRFIRTYTYIPTL